MSNPPPGQAPRPAGKPRKSQSYTNAAAATARAPSPTPSDQANGGTSDPKIRAYAACKSCRVKKIKCLPGPPSSTTPSGQPGPCTQCTQSNLECVYPPTRDRAAYSRQYVQNLESRVSELERGWARMRRAIEAWEGERGVKGEPLDMGHDGYDMDQTGYADDGELELEEHDRMAQTPAPRLGGQALQAHSVLASPNTAHGELTHDERGQFRWIGSSNTLSLMDSFQGAGPDGVSLKPHISPRPDDMSPPIDTSRPHMASRASNPLFAPVAGSGLVKALPSLNEVVYPSIEESHEMVDAFFREVFACLPVVDSVEFRRRFDALMERRARGAPENESGGFLSVLFAIFALGDRVIKTSRAWLRERMKGLNSYDPTQDHVMPGEAEAGVIWFERAQILHYTSLSDIDINQVQCLTLMSAFQASVNAMPAAWLLAGQAMRSAQDLGLHRRTPQYRMLFAEKQLCRRCWWAVYGLERMVSISLGRPLGVEDVDIDVPYPAEIDDEATYQLVDRDGADPFYPDLPPEAPEGVMSGFNALTKLCKIAGSVAHLLHRPNHGKSTNDPTWAANQQTSVNKLDKQVRDWLINDVPKKYRDPSPLRPIQLLSAVLSNSYFAVLITLHRNFLPPNPTYPRPKPSPSSQSLSHCVEAARSVIHIAAQQKILVPPSHHLAVACQYLWSSAVILLLCEVQARDQVVVDAVGGQVESCKRSLQALEPVWPGSRKLRELLVLAEIRARDVALLAASSSKKGKKRKGSGGEAQDKKARTSTTGAQNSTTQRSSSFSSPLSAWQNGQNATHGGGRSRISVSDTRTIHPDELAQGFAVPSNPSVFSNHNITPPISHPGQQQFSFNGTTLSFPPLDQSIDPGSLSFDGLEMLQGFTGASAASFWNTLTNDPFADFAQFIQDPTLTKTPVPTPGNGMFMTSPVIPIGPLDQVGQGQSSGPPQGNAHGQGRSQSQSGPGQQNETPGSGSGGGSQHGGTPGLSYTALGTGIPTGSSGSGEVGAGAEFWNPVVGGGLDWAQDPTVPFNI